MDAPLKHEPIAVMLEPPLISVDIDDTVDQVEAVLGAHPVSAVPVVDGATGRVVGIISARDLMRFHADKKDGGALHAWEICRYKPVEVDPGASVADVARLMVARAIHHVVVTENGQVKGIVSSLDFVKRYLRGESA
jgi:CBS domain-containing protein